MLYLPSSVHDQKLQRKNLHQSENVYRGTLEDDTCVPCEIGKLIQCLQGHKETTKETFGVELSIIPH